MMMSLTDVVVLTERVEKALLNVKSTSKRMFGGVTFLVRGNMLCRVSRRGLMVRVGAQAESEVRTSPYASPCVGAGRQMPGFIMIAPDALVSETDLSTWISLARSYVENLPEKREKKPPGGKRPSRPGLKPRRDAVAWHFDGT